MDYDFNPDEQIKKWRKRLGISTIGISSNNELPPEKPYIITEEGYRALSKDKEAFILEEFKIPTVPNEIRKRFGDSGVSKINYFLKIGYIEGVEPEKAVNIYIGFLGKRIGKVQKDIMITEVENFIYFAKQEEKGYHSTLQVELRQTLKNLEKDINDTRIGVQRDKFIQKRLETINLINEESIRRKKLEKEQQPLLHIHKKIESGEISLEELNEWEKRHTIEGELIKSLKELYDIRERIDKKDGEYKKRIEDFERKHKQEREELDIQIKDKEKKVSELIKKYKPEGNTEKLKE